MLKKKHLNKKIKNIINLTSIFLDKKKILIMKLIFIIYDLYKINVNNEKSLKESLSQASENAEKSIKKSASLVIEIDLIIRIKKIYKKKRHITANYDRENFRSKKDFSRFNQKRS